MRVEPAITIYASYAQDTLLREHGGCEVRQGGPAFYISQQLCCARTPFTLFAPEPAEVMIEMRDGAEVGTVSVPPVPRVIAIRKNENAAVLISSIFNEFVFTGNYLGTRVYLDVQGFVRAARVFNPAGFWCPSCALSGIPFCVKATSEELRFLPPAFVSVQKDRMLIITKGAEGCDVFVKGKQLSCKPKRRISAPDTLGAGDTFFAAFVASFERTRAVKRSVRYAMRAVEKFLQKKTKQ
jgi:hypothetical protein